MINNQVKKPNIKRKLIYLENLGSLSCHTQKNGTFHKIGSLKVFEY